MRCDDGLRVPCTTTRAVSCRAFLKGPPDKGKVKSTGKFLVIL